MDSLGQEYVSASATSNGHLLALTLSPDIAVSDNQKIDLLLRLAQSGSVRQDVNAVLYRAAQQNRFLCGHDVLDTWTEIYSAYILALLAIARAPKIAYGESVYEAWKAVANAVIKGYQNGSLSNWTLPVLYLVGRILRVFAMRADATKIGHTAGANVSKDDMITDSVENEKQEDAARVLNRMFTLCIGDRAPLADSRKWGIYFIANLLFKTYFRLNSISLSKNILRAISASKSDMPSASALPKSHVVTYNYYVGLIHFLEERYEEAEQHLTLAFQLCHRHAQRNKDLILTYLIPTHLLTSRQLPSANLLPPSTQFSKLFTPLKAAIQRGSLLAFDQSLERGESIFVRRRIYLTLERSRDICLRNLIRKVYIYAGEDDQGHRRTRIRAEEFGSAISFSESAEFMSKTGLLVPTKKDVRPVDQDEVECLLANLIYKGLMKGYISRAHAMVVLSKAGAFPGTTT